jgi:hypothetical protein
LANLNSVLPASNVGLSLSIVPISTSINLMPSNLAGQPFDNALVICRYQKLLTYVFSKIPNVQLVSMQFGNEIDAYAGANQVSFWSQWWTFYTSVAPTAKSLRPGLRTSIAATLYGTIGQSSNALAQGGLQQIFNAADAVIVTYYPLNGNFTVKPTTTALSDLSSLVSLYPNKPILFNEIGLPSGASFDASSTATQQDFIHQVFLAWDKYPTQITSMSFLRLNDISFASAQALATSYGLGSNSAFIEYLQTLGLISYSGTTKPAYNQLVSETHQRSW